MKMKIKASLQYTMKASNPDLKYTDGDLTKVREFTDTYNINTDNFECVEDISRYILNDLSCVANGGYDYGEAHINIVDMKLDNLLIEEDI